MLKLKPQHFGYLMEELTHWKRPWCWGRLKAGGEGDDRGWDGWMASPTPWTWVEQALGDSEEQGSLVCCGPWGHIESDTTERLNNNNRDKWWGCQQQFRILEQRTKRARDRVRQKSDYESIDGALRGLDINVTQSASWSHVLLRLVTLNTTGGRNVKGIWITGGRRIWGH